MITLPEIRNHLRNDSLLATYGGKTINGRPYIPAKYIPNLILWFIQHFPIVKVEKQFTEKPKTIIKHIQATVKKSDLKHARMEIKRDVNAIIDRYIKSEETHQIKRSEERMTTIRAIAHNIRTEINNYL